MTQLAALRVTTTIVVVRKELTGSGLLPVHGRCCLQVKSQIVRGVHELRHRFGGGGGGGTANSGVAGGRGLGG